MIVDFKICGVKGEEGIRGWQRKKYEAVLWSSVWLLTYFLEDGGDRNGLCGGNQGNGGVSKVDNNWRDNADDDLAVRLVLSRKSNFYFYSPTVLENRLQLVFDFFRPSLL